MPMYSPAKLKTQKPSQVKVKIQVRTSLRHRTLLKIMRTNQKEATKPTIITTVVLEELEEPGEPEGHP